MRENKEFRKIEDKKREESLKNTEQRNFRFDQCEIDEIIDALEERYNFLKSIITEDEDFMGGHGVKSDDVKFSLIEMSMIHDIWEKMK